MKKVRSGYKLCRRVYIPARNRYTLFCAVILIDIALSQIIGNA
nr:MAG TPA: hypothetical protein [Caudoviricetes sp.]